MLLQKAQQITSKLFDIFAPVCERLEVVGGVKREKKDVHDVEFLMILKEGRPLPEFGKPKNIYQTHLDQLLADMEYEGILRQASDKKDGARYKKRALIGTGELNEFCVDLFIVTEKTWGIQNVIRTGPALFSHRFVTNRDKKFYSYELKREFYGFLPNDLEYVRGETVIERGGVVLDLPSEKDVIELLGVGWIPWTERASFALERTLG